MRVYLIPLLLLAIISPTWAGETCNAMVAKTNSVYDSQRLPQDGDALVQLCDMVATTYRLCRESAIDPINTDADRQQQAENAIRFSDELHQNLLKALVQCNAKPASAEQRVRLQRSIDMLDAGNAVPSSAAGSARRGAQPLPAPGGWTGEKLEKYTSIAADALSPAENRYFHSDGKLRYYTDKGELIEVEDALVNMLLTLAPLHYGEKAPAKMTVESLDRALIQLARQPRHPFFTCLTTADLFALMDIQRDRAIVAIRLESEKKKAAIGKLETRLIVQSSNNAPSGTLANLPADMRAQMVTYVLKNVKGQVAIDYQGQTASGVTYKSFDPEQNMLILTDADGKELQLAPGVITGIRSAEKEK
ncbi:MAG: hypothetical protein ACYDBB_22460 [Armatimonadota bacterium]